MIAASERSRLQSQVTHFLRLARGTAPVDPAADIRRRLLQHGLGGPALHDACACVDRASGTLLRQVPYPTQWLAALALLRGRLVDMTTGEGKTLALALAASVAALAGRRVHLITANDYLAGRDAAAMRPLYAHLGLTVAAVSSRSSERARRTAYAQDIVYVTGRELVFDALRDRLAGVSAGVVTALQRSLDALGDAAAPPPLLPGFDFALIDEADSVLLDEAQLPFVVSRPSDARWNDDALPALGIARTLRRDDDFTMAADGWGVRLSPQGRERVAGCDAGQAWVHELQRDQAVERALVALHGLQRDRDYLVRDGEVLLIDPVSGRLAPGRQWSHGLHALVAAKEGCASPPAAETAAETTYPEFFARYRQVAGISGTLVVARRELRSLYGLRVLRVPLARPSRRHEGPTRVFDSADARWRAVVARASTLAAQDRPVLVGTDSVADSRALAAHFTAAGIEVVVLNAAQDEHEARIVAQAGRPGCITVATNMAGRGTDITLPPASLAAGGLHVICCQANASRRLDQQLAGRCARRGEPGSVEFWLLGPTERDGLQPVARLVIQAVRRLSERLPSAQRWGIRWARWRQQDREAEAADRRRRTLALRRAIDERLGTRLGGDLGR